MKLFTAALAAVLAFAVTNLLSAEKWIERQSLFEAHTDGYALYRIPGLVVTQQGTVLAYCEARRTGKSDWDSIDIMMRRSTDGGKTWSDRVKISDVPGEKIKNPLALEKKLANGDDVTYNNAVAFADRQGPVHLLYCLEYCRCFYIRSDDDGLTWTRPVEITSAFEQFRDRYDWKVLATGPAHGIQLRSGRLVVPVWLSTGTGGHAHRPSVTSTIYSDDQGKTWQAGEIAVPDTPEWIYPNETVIVELIDGSVMLNVRSESATHRRIVTTSRDGATQWTEPRFDNALLEPICMASIIRHSQVPESDKNRILFANPDNLERTDGTAQPSKSRDRRNLSIKLSYDEGKTWSYNKMLEPSYSAYSDMAVLPDGTALCLFEHGRAGKGTDKKPTNYAGLTLARFNIEWLTDGQDVPSLNNKKDSFGGKREDFSIDDFKAFVIHPARPRTDGTKPWVWYAPSIGAHPGAANHWLFKRLLEQGFYVAGAYVGESYANPRSRDQFAELYRHLIAKHGLAPKACLLAQSRGGLNHFNFASDHPEWVACIAGIFPVADLRSYPSLHRASPSYGLSPDELDAQLSKHNPIDRLAPIAAARIPIFLTHGNIDKLVPLENNSQVLYDRYRQLGGEIELVVVEGKGHQNDAVFFESPAMLEFILRNAFPSR